MSTGTTVLGKAITASDLELSYRERTSETPARTENSEFIEFLCDWASADELMKLQVLHSL